MMAGLRNQSFMSKTPNRATRFWPEEQLEDTVKPPDTWQAAADLEPERDPSVFARV